MKWGKDDGVGAIFISPTRELAMQIFQEIVKVGGITHLVWLYLLEEGFGEGEERSERDESVVLYTREVVATHGRDAYV